MHLLIAGATGLVGGQTLRLALLDPGISQVTAPGRRSLPGGPRDPRLSAPVLDLAAGLPASVLEGVHAVACALGSTRRKAASEASREGIAASSAEAFRARDFDLILGLARAAHAAGVARFGLVSSVGADASARGLYLRTKGELEREIGALGFASFTVLRPSVLDGARTETRPLERLGLGLARALGPLIPRRYRAVSAADVAATLLARLKAGEAGLTVLESEQLTPS